MKVCELAKELDIKSKDITTFLNDKNIEVKAANSKLEDDAVELVKKKFSSDKKHEQATTTKKREPEDKKTEDKNLETKMEETKTEAAKGTTDKAEAVDHDVVKKKKNIIFVSNPHNSKISGTQRTPAQNSNNNSYNNNNNNSGTRQNNTTQYRPTQLIRPTEPPKPIEAYNTPRATESVQTSSGANTRPTGERRPTTSNGEHRAPQARNNYQRNDGQYHNNNGGNNTGYRGNNSGAGNNAGGYRGNSGAGTGGSGTGYRGNNTGTGNTTGGYRGNNAGNGTGNSNGGYRGNSGTGTGGSGTGYRGNNAGGTRTYGNNGGGGYNNRGGNGQERTGARNDQRGTTGTGRPYNNNNTGNRGGYQGGQNSGRPYNNNDRFGKGDGREDNRFRKPGQGSSFISDSPISKDAEKHRDEEKRRIGQEKDKRSKKDMIYEEDNNKLKNKNKAGRFIKPEKKEETKEEQIKVIKLDETLTIKELADKMKLQPSAIIKKLFLQGKIVTVNTELTYEEAENIAIEYDIICEHEEKIDVIEELLKEEDEVEEELTARPPVICVMGHVDHGKTSLLDAIRKTNVTDREAGGITQAIGAYTVNIKNQSITFLDTPGHEAFTAMRMRGANSTDIAVLVVAADDGVMPQTVEAINHAKAAGIEIIVAVNKVDKPNANIERVKQEMTEYELVATDWGGTTEFVPVSAKTGEGISNLLETIILTAEILELKANTKRKARGLVIEAKLDKGRGPVATVLVQKGTLHMGDFISAGACHGKVRAMLDDKGRSVKEAGPSTPVEILGLSDVPNAGEIFIAHENDKTAKSFAETYLAQNKQKKIEETKAKMSLDDLFTQIQEGNLKELDVIIKADVQGSVEALKQSLLKLSNEEVVVKCIHGGVGAINESDVILASASNAIIIGFNVRPDAQAKTAAEREGVDVRLYRVIYQAIEDIEAAMKGMLDPIFEEKVIGHAEVRQIFKASAIGNIAGSYVLDGEFKKDCKVRITREGKQIFEGGLSSLKRFKDDVKEVKAGFECGFVFDGFDQMQELDIVEAYIMVEVPR